VESQTDEERDRQDLSISASNGPVDAAMDLICLCCTLLTRAQLVVHQHLQVHLSKASPQNIVFFLCFLLENLHKMSKICGYFSKHMFEISDQK